VEIRKRSDLFYKAKGPACNAGYKSQRMFPVRSLDDAVLQILRNYVLCSNHGRISAKDTNLST